MPDKTHIDEMALIGNCIMLRDEHLKLDVSPADFKDPILAVVWKWMQTVQTIEPLDIDREFYEHRAMLAECVDSRYAESVQNAAQRVKEAAHRRRVLQAIKTAYKAIEGGSSIHTAVENVLSAADGVKSGDGNKHLSDFLIPAYRDIEDAQVNGKSSNYIQTGFRDFDDRFGGLQSDGLVVIAGRPSMGKSALMSAIARNVAKEKPVLVLSMEMSGKQIAMRYYASESGVDLQSMMQGNMTTADWNKLAGAQKALLDLGIFINDQQCRSVTDIAAEARRFRRVHNDMGMLCIDYLGLLEMDLKRGKNEAIGEVTRRLAGLAGELQCPVVLLSQLNRDLEKRTNKKPVMADLRDSGAIEQDADQIIFPFRPEVYDDSPEYRGIALLIVAKNRHGSTGEVAMSWCAPSVTFKDFAGGRFDEY